MSFSQKFGLFLTVACVTFSASFVYADTGLISSTYLASRKINGASLTNASTYFYGTGAGDATSAAKTVTINTIDAANLTAGQVIVVNPSTTSGNTGSTTLTLRLNPSQTGAAAAKEIYYNGSAVNTAALGEKIWKSGVPATFVYDGSHWVFAGSGSDTGETYTQGTGITISNGTISNAGVRDVNTTGVQNGQIKINKGGTETTVTVAGTMTGASVANNTPTAGASGLVPAPAAGDNVKFLRGDGSWATPTDTDTTYSDFVGVHAVNDVTVAGTAGLVPAPAVAEANKFLKGDGSWATPTDTTYSNFTTATNNASGTAGLVQATAGSQDKFLTGSATWSNIKVPVTAGGDPNATSSPAAVSSMASIWIDNTAL